MLRNGLLAEKVALVTGAGRGIGNKTVERFAKEGAIVYATAISEGSLDTFAKNPYLHSVANPWYNQAS